MTPKNCAFCGNKAKIKSWKKGKCRHLIGCSDKECPLYIFDDILWAERFNYGFGGCWVNLDQMIEAWDKRYDTFYDILEDFYEQEDYGIKQEIPINNLYHPERAL